MIRRLVTLGVTLAVLLAALLPCTLRPFGNSQVGVASAAEQEPGTVSARTIALGVYYPALPRDLERADGYRRVLGNPLTILHWFVSWGAGDSALHVEHLEAVSARGAVPLITWEPWRNVPADPEWTIRDAILSGRSDAYIRSWAEGLADYERPVLLRFAHQMHNRPEYLDQAYPWTVGTNGNTAEEYVAAWRHIHAIFQQAGATNVQWVWSPNILGEATAHEYWPQYLALYPGDEYVDWLGLDLYNTGPDVNWGAPYWRSFSSVLAEPYNALTRLTDKPIILAEVGSTETGGSKSAWIMEALTQHLATDYPRVRALVWFDIRKEAAWDLQSSPEAFGAWVEASRRPHFRPDPIHPIWGREAGSLPATPDAPSPPARQTPR